MSLEQWIKSLWQALMLNHAVPLLVKPELRSLWWHNIISDDFEHSHIWPVASTVKQAIAAMRLVIEWEITDEQLSIDIEGNCACFYRWLGRYRAKVKQQHSLDQFEQINYIIDHLNAIQSALPVHLLCYAFDDITPQTQSLLSAIEQAGCTIDTQSPASKQPKIFRYDAPDLQTERKQALAFAQQHQPNSRTDKKPVTIVVPDLAAQRLGWANDCQDWFDVESSIQIGEKAQLPYNISGGETLDKVPVIQAALDWLTLFYRPMDWQTYARCIASPFIQGGVSWAPTRQVALNQIAPHKGMDSFVNWWQLTQPLLAIDDPLLAMIPACQAQPTVGVNPSIAQWVPTWLALLEGLGWPGERIVTSQEYQAIIQWQQVLEGLLVSDYHQSTWTAHQALMLAEQGLTQSVFQPETQHDLVTTQVLGILEAAGQSVEKLWITGLSQHHWPPAPNPNPFLPLTLQRSLGLPHASSERETQYAQKIFQTLIHSADMVVLSYAVKTDRGEQFPSPLLDTIETEPYKPQAAILAVKALTQVDVIPWVEQAPSALTSIKPQYPSSLLSHQSQCPFKAFAIHRLGIKQPAEDYLGLSPAIRGQMLHQVLQFYYQHPAPTESVLSKLVSDCVTMHAKSYPAYFQSIENKRLLDLVSSVIAVDDTRENFVFLGLEQRLGLTFGDIQLSMKVDRLDKDALKHQWLIDYKTGAVKVDDWLGDRPYDVQMLLYAIATPQFPDVIAYYAVKPKGTKIIGISKLQTQIKGVEAMQEEWPLMVEQWKHLLSNLAKDFQSGSAMVSPIDKIRCCQYCHLHSLCRIGIEEQAAC